MDRIDLEIPALRQFRRMLTEAYGARLDRAVLFGSRARGDARPDSDFDVAVFLHDMGSLWDELGPLSEMTTDVLLSTGALISAKPLRAESRDDPRPLLREIRRDGIEL